MIVKKDISIAKAQRQKFKQKTKKPDIKVAVLVDSSSKLEDLYKVIAAFRTNRYTKKKLEIIVLSGTTKKEQIQSLLSKNKHKIKLTFKRKPFEIDSLISQLSKKSDHDLLLVIGTSTILGNKSLSVIANKWLEAGKPRLMPLNPLPLQDDRLVSVMASYSEPKLQSVDQDLENVVARGKNNSNQFSPVLLNQKILFKKVSYANLADSLKTKNTFFAVMRLSQVLAFGWFCYLAVHYDQPILLSIFLLSNLFTMANNVLSNTFSAPQKIKLLLFAPAFVIPNIILIPVVYFYRLIWLAIRFLSRSAKQSSRSSHQSFATQ